MDYKEYNDYELLSHIREANEEASEILIKKYRPLIISIATKLEHYCHNKGVDINDLIQEGNIGLNDAINAYDEDKEASFSTYAKTCIERRIMSLVVSTRRLKNKILNDSLPLVSSSDDEVIVDKFLIDNSANPLDMVAETEWEQNILHDLANDLTDFESQVFELKKNQFNYKEIADILDRSPKAVDNAIQRIKIKLKNILKKNKAN